MIKIAKLIESRQKIDKKIEDIQKRCPHSSKSVKSVRERVDSTSTVIRWVCDECFKIIGYPTQFEMDKFCNE
tara:strand:+ start:139 stop:354 length:216 start_codon:yes stop_codon:yes gene_type:complete